MDTQEWGYIDFSPQGMNEVFGGEKLSYEEYLGAQKAMRKNIRGWFFLCHHEVPLGFARQIERISSEMPGLFPKMQKSQKMVEKS